MAIYYLDLTPAANGFGTGTGNWTGATNWTTSATGASGTNVNWPGLTTDSIKFGDFASGTALTAGTLTVNSNVTVTGISSDNLTGGVTVNGRVVGQRITGSSTLTLSNGSTVSTTSGATSALFIDCPISATGTHSFTCATNQGVYLSGTGTSGMTGTLQFTNPSYLIVNQNAQSFFATSTQIQLIGNLGIQAWVSGLSTATINGNFSSSTNNRINFHVDSSGAQTYNFTGDLSGMTGNSEFLFRGTSPNFATVITKTLPARLTADVSAPIQVTVNADSNLSCLSTGIVNAVSTSFLNSSGVSGITVTGTVSSSNTFQLGGTALGNLITGPFATPSGTFTLVKADAGSWQANGSGATINGGININGGTYTVGNSSVTNGTAAVTVAAGTTLGVANNIASFNAPINLSGTLNNVSGSNNISSTLTVAANTAVIRAESGTLTRTFTNTINAALTVGNVADAGDIVFTGTSSGTGSISKVGPRRLTFGASVSGVSGTTTLTGGTLAIRLASYFTAGTFTFNGDGVLEFEGSSTSFLPGVITKALTHSAGATGGLSTGSILPNSVYADFSGAITLSATSTLALQGANTNNNTISTAFAGSAAAGITKSGVGKWVLSGANNLTGTTNVNAGTLVVSNNAYANKLAGGTVNVNQGGRLQTGIAGTQKGRCTYNTLKLNGAPGTPARIRIGGSVASPTTYLNGNLTLPTGADKTTWDVSGYSEILKTPGTYTLIAWTTAAGQIAAGDVTANVTLTGLPTGMTASLTYDFSSVPRRILITTIY